METITVECGYCGIRAGISTMEVRERRGHVCRDAAACMAREDAQADEEERDEQV